MSFPELLCPSFRGSPYADPETKKAAITNYRAMGATHIESLGVASPHPMRPKYGEGSAMGGRGPHPDGACFPGDGLKIDHRAFQQGLSNTMVAVESMEPTICPMDGGGRGRSCRIATERAV